MAIDPSRLYQQLQNTGVQNKDTPMYQLLRSLIDTVTKQFREVANIETSIIPIIPPDVSDEDFITHADNVASLPNSRRLLAGTNITFDDSIANERTIDAAPFPPFPDDYVVLSDGSIASGSDTTGAHVYLDTDIVVGVITPLIVSWTNELVDEDNYWVIGSPTRLTAPIDGWYIIRGQIKLDSIGSGRLYLAIIQNGVTEIAKFDNFYTASNNAIQVAITRYLLAGQHVELQYALDPPQTILSGQFESYFQILLPGTASISPSPINDGFGNFVYVPYTP